MPRVATSARTTAGNRVAARDMKASLGFNGTSSTISLTTSVVSTTGDFSLAAWVNPAFDSTYNTSDRSFLVASGFDIGLQYNVASRRMMFLHFNTTPTSFTLAKDDQAVRKGEWTHYLGTFNATTKVMSLYRNGVLVGSDTMTGTPRSNTAWNIGSASAARFFAGFISEAQVFDYTVSSSQVLSVMNGSLKGNVRSYSLNEGAGSTAMDSSVNATNATITAGTYSFSTPTKARQPVNRNLIYNGDFEYAPPFTAAGTTAARWIDGTAAGSLTNDLFGWSLQEVTGTSASACFDNGRLKLSTLATGTTVTALNARIYNDNASIKKNALPIVAGQSYTVSLTMETLLNSGTSNSGAYVDVAQYTSAGVLTGGVLGQSTAVKTTTGPTKYTFTITPAANAAYVTVSPRIVNNGAATLIMDAWYDDIMLMPTTPIARTVVT